MPNLNTRNGSIHNCRKHATTNNPNKKAKAKVYAKTKSGEQYDTYEFFAHDGVVYRKASDQYRVDEGKGRCQSCVRGAKYKHGHHHTCERATNYCDKRQKMLDEIKQRLQYEGREGGYCDPNTGVVLNLVETNGSLEPLLDRPPPNHKFFTPEMNRAVLMSEQFSIDYDGSVGSEISTEMNLISQSITTQEIERRKEDINKRKQQQHQQAKQGWNQLFRSTAATVVVPPTGVVLADDQTTVSNVTDLNDKDNKHIVTEYNYTDDLLLPERITSEINLRLHHPYTMKQIKKKGKLSVPVAAFIEYLLDLFPFFLIRIILLNLGKLKKRHSHSIDEYSDRVL